MSQQADRRVGSVIGAKWRVDALLGSGSMAVVYAVTHRNGARAALKILHPTLCTEPAVCERFLGEGYLANSVKHAGIVRVLDDGVTDDGCVYLVMDLLEGMTLEALREVRGGRFPLIEILDIADELMDVLHAVHEAGIVHRDLKPQNVFVCNDGSVKLLDFGVARLLDGNANSKVSMFGLVLGTPSFMSPEQAVGAREKVDHRSDIWSLGATLFTAITGQTVHLGPHVQARLLAAATVPARSIAWVRHDLPPSLAAAIDAALRFEKEDRWQTVAAFRRACRDARAHGVGVERSATTRDSDAEVSGEVCRPDWATSSEPPLLPTESRSLADSSIDVHNAAPNGVVAIPTAARARTTVGSRFGASRFGALGRWLAGVGLTAAAIGGISFFAVRRVEAESSVVSPSPVTERADSVEVPNPADAVPNPADAVPNPSVEVPSPADAVPSPAPILVQTPSSDAPRTTKAAFVSADARGRTSAAMPPPARMAHRSAEAALHPLAPSAPSASAAASSLPPREPSTTNEASSTSSVPLTTPDPAPTPTLDPEPLHTSE